LLTVVSLYWHTGSITTSLRDYVDNRDNVMGADDFVSVATAVAEFHQFLDDGVPPREWVERLYNVRRWTRMPAGGHFPAAEHPELLAADIRAFFGELTSTIRA
jgi:pimeloyl-ACP methyl ester carboxylesterase